MKKTLLITIIAIVLVISVAGTCFALYKQEATPKTVNITATGGQICNLTIDTNASLDFSGINPTNRTKSVDVTLNTSNNNIVDGVHGNFKVTKSGEIAEFIAITVNSIATIGGDTGSAIASATEESGMDVALSTVPVYVRVTMTLTEAGANAFASVAEKTGSVTLAWTVDQTTIFAYDADAYYLVGKVNGVTKWYPTADSIILNDEIPQGKSDVANEFGVELKAGDSFKVVKNFKSNSPAWYGGQENNGAQVVGVSVGSDNGDINITADGTYDIFVNNQGRVWVAIHTND